MKYFSAFTFLFFALTISAKAQPSLYKITAKMAAGLPAQLVADRVNIVTPVQGGILFKANKLTQPDAARWLADQLEMRPGLDALNEKSNPAKTPGNLEVNSFNQYYNGIKVEHGMVNITSRNGNVAMMQLEFYSIPDRFTTKPALAETAALQKAAAALSVPDSLFAQYGLQKEWPKPPGELVIVRTYDDDSTVCLAWKFDIFNPDPMAEAMVYVNAQTGKVVLIDNLIKHSNADGSAATRYSGNQTIVTDNGSADPAKPYRLRQTRNGHNIITLNYQAREFNAALNNNKATDFTDNDNNWEAREFKNAAQDDVALDVQLNMQIISDYWKTVHGRNSWDNANSPLTSYVHVNVKCGTVLEPQDNAFWSQTAMYFGDGTFGTLGNACAQNYRPFTSLDVTAHEVGHAITQSTSRLVYRWESGAINEAFSDIWCALIEKWGVEQNPTIGAGKKTWIFGEEISPVIGAGARDMQNPRNFNNPSTYKDNYWKTASYPDCLPNDPNDECGVHNNSGVLNKWFYLVTVGESAVNSLGQPYNVTGMGFTKSASLAYITTLNLTPNAGYQTTKAVTMDAATTLFGVGSPEVETVRSAWRAVGVDSAIWDMSNTPAFAVNNTQSFSSIALGKNNTIWAGTDKKGLYVFDGTNWTQRSEITNVKINDLKADKAGGIWVAQSGTVNSGTATAGGVNYFADPAAAMTGFYTVSAQTNIPTRNVRTIFVDQNRLQNGTNPRVWIATNTYINSSGNSTSGKPALGFNSTSPNFTGINAGIETANNTGGVTAIGGDKNTIWTFAALNYGKNQIISYDAGSGALIAAYDNSTESIIPANLTVKAIYTDKLKRTWFGLGTNAVLVIDELQLWHYISFPASFIAGSQVNFNAITGSPYGDVYIGTTAGLIFFDNNGYLDLASNYKLFKKQNGLPSSNVTGIAYDKTHFKVWLSTDQGICRWDPLCLGNGCNEGTGYAKDVSSAASGKWSDPATWEDNIIPDSTMDVFIDNHVEVDINAGCKSLSVLKGGAITVDPDIKLTIYRKQDGSIQTGVPAKKE